jgi:oligopeptide transport system substrate-binding protein
MVNINGKDYWEMGGLDKYAYEGNLFDEATAKKYKDAAMKELAGKVTFPIQIVVPFNGDSASDAQIVFEQQLERTMGKDYIDVVLQQVSVASFAKEIRNVGKWSMYHTGWGPDYEDPLDIYPYLLQGRSGANFGKMYLAEEYYDAALGYGTREYTLVEVE